MQLTLNMATCLLRHTVSSLIFWTHLMDNTWTRFYPFFPIYLTTYLKCDPSAGFLP